MRNKIYIIIGIVSLLCIHTNLFSQFLGGNASGYDMDSVNYKNCPSSAPTLSDIYYGGNAGGYDMDSINYSNCSTSSPTLSDIYFGGNASGYDMDSVNYKNCPSSTPVYADIYFGGNAAGFDMDSVNYSACTAFTPPALADIYLGGNATGYDMDKIEYLACIPCTVSVKLGNDTTVCSGSSIYLDVTGIGYSYAWSTGNTTGSITVNPTVTTKYSVTVSDLTCSRADTITVTISPDAKISGNSTICKGDSTTLTASGGTSYLWSTAETSSAVTVTPIADTKYFVTVSDSVCSGTDTASVLVTVTTNSTSASVSGDTVICSGNTTTLTASGGTTYLWSINDSTNAVTVNPTTNTTYTVTVSNGSCSDTSISVTVTVNASPATPVITKNGNVLTSDATTGNQWYKDGNFTGITTQTYTATVNGNYYVIVTNTDGCSDTSATVSVVVGIEEGDFTQNTLVVYPNPHDGKFRLSFEVTNKEDYTIEIIDVLGQVVYKEVLKQFTGSYTSSIDISKYEKGVYMLWIKTSDNATVRKTLIQSK